MAGFSNITGDESIMFANNASFDGTERNGKMTSDGQLWIGSSIAPHVRKGNLASNDGSITITTGAGTINLTDSLGAGRFPVTPYVVGPLGLAGYQTVQSALNAASTAGGGIVYLQPGSYTENLTLYDNTQVVGGLGFSDTGSGATIVGVHTPPSTGSFIFRNVKLQSATHIFSSAVAGSAHLIVADSAVAVTNGYLYNLPNWTGILENYDINCSFGTNDGFVNNTASATVVAYSCSIGAGTGNSASISGTLYSEGTYYSCPLNFVTGAAINFDGCQFSRTVTLSNNSTGYFDTCHFITGATAAITMSSSAAISLTNSTINSSNNPAIDGAGAGTLTYSGISFLSNASFAGTLTLAGDPSFFTGRNATVGAGNSGSTNTLTLTNPSNTASSQANEVITVGGATAGDPFTTYTVSGVTNWSQGIDNSVTGDPFVLSASTTLGTTNVLSATTSGSITKPLQPSFYGALTSTASNATGDGTIVTLTGFTEAVDRGNNFDPTTGTFTAPVTGIYNFYVKIRLGSISAGHTSAAYSLVTTSTTYQLLSFNPFTTQDTVAANVALASSPVCISMSSGDTATFTVQVSGSTKTVAIQGTGNATVVAGYLLA